MQVRRESPQELVDYVRVIAINLALILVTVIGGRITPSFTATALRQRGVDATVRSRRAMTPVVVVLMVAVAAIDLVRPGSALAGAVALAAAATQAARLAQWQGHRTLRDPIVWILHAAMTCITQVRLCRA